MTSTNDTNSTCRDRQERRAGCPCSRGRCADSVDELLADATERRSFITSDSKSGNPFERVTIGGEPHVVKYVHVDDDFTIRGLGDLAPRALTVWSTGLVDVAPAFIDHALVGAARGIGRNGWGAALLMRDVSASLVPPGDESIRSNSIIRCSTTAPRWRRARGVPRRVRPDSVRTALSVLRPRDDRCRRGPGIPDTGSTHRQGRVGVVRRPGAALAARRSCRAATRRRPAGRCSSPDTVGVVARRLEVGQPGHRVRRPNDPAGLVVSRAKGPCATSSVGTWR